jgi:holo-[acyl-carrier protein] synthase
MAMIIGVGIDSIEIARVAAKCADTRYSFAQRLFTPVERERAARNQRSPYQHLAACFAAREAFFKATQILYQRDKVSVAQQPSGQPYYVLAPEITDKLALLAGDGGGVVRLHLSLTHDATHAVACCVCEAVSESTSDKTSG